MGRWILALLQRGGGNLPGSGALSWRSGLGMRVERYSTTKWRGEPRQILRGCRRPVTISIHGQRGSRRLTREILLVQNGKCIDQLEVLRWWRQRGFPPHLPLLAKVHGIFRQGALSSQLVPVVCNVEGGDTCLVQFSGRWRQQGPWWPECRGSVPHLGFGTGSSFAGSD